MINPSTDFISMVTYVSQFPEAKLKEGVPLKKTGDPTKVKAYGDGLEAFEILHNGVEAHQFFVDVSEAGNGPLKVNVITPQGQAFCPENEYDNIKKLFTYTYSIGVKQCGEYTINILWCGRPILNSPFKVNVTLTQAKQQGMYHSFAGIY